MVQFECDAVLTVLHLFSPTKLKGRGRHAIVVNRDRLLNRPIQPVCRSHEARPSERKRDGNVRYFRILLVLVAKLALYSRCNVVTGPRSNTLKHIQVDAKGGGWSCTYPGAIEGVATGNATNPAVASSSCMYA